MKNVFGWMLLTLMGAWGCSNRSKEAAPPPPEKAEKAEPQGHSDEAEHEELPKRVRLSKEVISDAKIKTAVAVKETLAVTISLPGEINADPDKSARISTPVSGRLVELRFKEGSAVRKGEVLALVRIPEIGKVRASFSATKGKAASARANAERLGFLVDKGLASKQESVSAQAEADALDAETRALQEQLGALGMGSTGGGSELVLRAPVSGIVMTRDAVVGQPITTEQTIATISDLSEVWFLGRVFEKDLGQLKVGAKADVELNAYPKERFDGSIEYLGRQIDPISRTVTARIRLTNRSDLLRVGLFGTARVATGDGAKAQVLVVPRTAITEIAGNPVAFVRHADDDFEIHELVLGASSLGKVEIVNGLREGEQVVVEGIFTLKSVVLKSTISEEEE